MKLERNEEGKYMTLDLAFSVDFFPTNSKIYIAYRRSMFKSQTSTVEFKVSVVQIQLTFIRE